MGELIQNIKYFKNIFFFLDKITLFFFLLSLTRVIIILKQKLQWFMISAKITYYDKRKLQRNFYKSFSYTCYTGFDINVCPIPVKTDVGQVDLALRLSDGTNEKIRFPNVPVRRTNLFPLV